MTMLEKLIEFMNSPEGAASIERMAQKMINKDKIRELQLTRAFQKFHGQENTIIDKLIEKYYSYEYIDREHRLGYQPREPLLFFLYEYATKYGKKFTRKQEKKYGNSFSQGGYIIGSYAIIIMFGQGTVIKIMDL